MSAPNLQPPHHQQPPNGNSSKTEIFINNSKLAPYMVGNIVIIAIGVLATVIVMMFADFDGKIVRVISTLLLFAAFTVFAAIDANRDKPGRYIQIGQIGHMYMLALTLTMIWGTFLSGRSSMGFAQMGIIMNTLLLVGIIKLAIWVIQIVSGLIGAKQPGLALSSLISSGAVAAIAVLYTLPMGLNDFFTFGDLYWRMAFIVVVIGGGAMSVTGMLFHLYKEKEPNAPSEMTGRPGSQSKPPSYGDYTPRGNGAVASAPPSYNGAAPEGYRQPQKPVRGPQTGAPGYDPRQYVQPPASVQNPPAQPQQGAPAGPPQFAPPVQGVQPWPVYPHGMPLPANEHGRPDFKALQHIAGMYAEAERQWFGK